MSFSAIILAGGKSSRMGEDKAFMRLGDKLIYDWVIDTFEHLSCEIIVSGCSSWYESPGVRHVSDVYKGAGPLAGLHAGLVNARHGKAFAAACDMPFLTPDFVEYMFERLGDADAVVPVYRDLLQPLCSVYRRTCIPFIEERLLANKNKLTGFYADIKVERVYEREIQRIIDPEVLFLNVNTPQDLELAEKIAAEKG